MRRTPPGRLPESIGPFAIRRSLGMGGMAATFEGIRRGPAGFEQRVCVKRIRRDLANHPELRRMFFREARLAATLSHRNVTRVVDFGEEAYGPYLALELVAGMDLRRFLRSHKKTLPVSLVALLGLEIAEALEHAHLRRVIHRDVSPANILLSPAGDIKLTDFGIAKVLSDSPTTRSEFTRGNAWYMPPERFNEPTLTDARSDLFSLGVVLYECAAGRRPYRCTTDLAALIEAAAGRVVPIREAAPQLDDSMAAIIERLLAPRLEDRFVDPAALIDALSPFVRAGFDRRHLRELVRRARLKERSKRLESAATERALPPRITAELSYQMKTSAGGAP